MGVDANAGLAPELLEALAALRERIAQAKHWAVLSGAGMSAESGIPTFRDAQSGFWAQFDPMQLASEPGYREDPQRVWNWYAERREGVRAARPNPGHRVLGRYAAQYPGRLTVISQNVDDLHQRAGNEDTLRLHGDILADRWLDSCPRRGRGAAVCATSTALPGEPPVCGECGNLLRPGVVWFGEALPAQVLAQAEAAAVGAQVLLVVGTAGAVWPAAGLAELARQAGGWVAIINPNPSEIDGSASQCLRGTAATLLPALLEPLLSQDEGA